MILSLNKFKNNGYIWNGIAGILNALEAVIFSMIVLRLFDLETVGIISFALVSGNLFSAIGKFGVRNYQVTDSSNYFSFEDYFLFRIITVVAMCISAVVYVFTRQGMNLYSNQKTYVILLFCLIYATESFEDVIWGEYQKQGRIDIGAKIFIIRWISMILGFSFFSYTFCNILVSTLVAFLLGIAVEIGFVVYSAKHGISYRILEKINIKSIKNIFFTTFPLFLSTFLVNYINNAPKYAIDRIMSDDIQAYYGYIAMPVFAISLLNGFIYQPQLVGISSLWNSSDINKFRMVIKRQMLIILGLMVICFAGAYILGIPVFKVIFNIDLTIYESEFLMMIFGSGLLAVTGYFMVILTIMRQQKLVLYGYTIVAILALLLSRLFVTGNGISGAVALFIVTMLINMLIFIVFYLFKINKVEKVFK